MSVDRRDFLKLAGLATVAGVTGGQAASSLGQSQQTMADVGQYEKLSDGKRLAMVIDLRKWTKEDARASQEVCHKIHNVPRMEDPEEEVKWIWTEPSKNAFPDQSHRY